jgi:methionyl-tRNA synthetase
MSTAVLTAVAWAYKNGARHIGHKSGSGVASGVFARCHRMAGNRVLMVSGTDEPQGLPEVDAPFASGPGGREGRRRSDTLLRRVQDRPRTVFA